MDNKQKVLLVFKKIEVNGFGFDATYSYLKIHAHVGFRRENKRTNLV